MKIVSAKPVGMMPTYDLSMEHEHHSFLHSSGVVMHNCAFVIADKPISSFIPLTTVSDVRVTEYTAGPVEEAGGVKMDFLVINSLRDIGYAINLIQQRYALPKGRTLQLNGIEVPAIQAIPVPRRNLTVLVTGGREFEDRDRLWAALDRLHKKHRLVKVIHGGARGADTFAALWARDRRVQEEAHRPDWDAWGDAGKIRNTEMLQQRPDFCLAAPGAGGTADMAKKAADAGVPVLFLEEELPPVWLDIWSLPEDQAVFDDIVSGHSETVFQFNCLDAETEALTKRGWVKGFDLTMDDVLLTKNPKTGRAEWQKPTDLRFFPDYEGPLVEFKSRSFHAVTTPDHRWLVTSASGDVRERTSASMTSDFSIHRTAEYVYDGQSALTPDEAEVLGWFVTDGHYERHKKCSGVRRGTQAGVYACITQSERANPEKCNRINQLLLQLSPEVTSRMTSSGCRIWRLGSRLTSLMLRLAPRRSLEIAILLDLDKVSLQRLMEVIMLGDGCGERRMVTGREEQADAFQVLLTLLGFASSKKWRDMSMYEPRSDKMQNIPKMTGCWIVTRLKSKGVRLRVQHRRTYQARTAVWCPMVPNTFFFARRGGQTWVTGNTPGARKWMQHFNHPKPDGHKVLDSIMSMAIFTALDRPGPLDARVKNPDGTEHNMLVEYARRARGMPRASGIECFDGLMPETYDILIMQEQVQRLYQHFTGCTGAEAEEFRRLVAKKKADKLFKIYPKFIAAAGAKVGEERAKQVWDAIHTFSAYGFNLSHAVCYSVIGYACAYLKHYFPLEWWTSVLRNADKDEISEVFWPHCGKYILLPDVKLSGANFQIEGDKIRAPISLLLGVGETAHKQLCTAGPYEDIQDFCNKIEKWKVDHPAERGGKKVKGRSAIHSGIAYTLIISGAMDSLFPPGTPTIQQLAMYEEAIAKASDPGGVTKRGKPKKPKKVKPVDQRYINITPLERHQMRKKILPAFSASVLPYIQHPRVGMGVKRMVLQLDDNVLSFATAREIEQVHESGTPMVLAVAGYVEAVRAFEHGENKCKKSYDFSIDICGGRMNFVRWQRSNDPAPFDPKCAPVGSIVIAIINKWSATAKFSIDHIIMVKPPLASAEEESAE